jgi:hypothetical protein
LRSIVFYISGHGFGHAVRQIEIINALGAAAPEVVIVARTSAPAWLFDRTCRVPITRLPGEVDTGVVQKDSLRLDEGQTIERAADFYRTLDSRAEAEATLLRSQDAGLVIADAPPLACAAAHRAGVPSIVCANFTWDWIYASYAEQLSAFPHLLPAVQFAYRHAAGAWRMPMHGGFETIAPVVDMPFVARHARPDVSIDDLRRELALPVDARLALATFGGYGVADLALDQLDCAAEWRVIVTVPGRDVPAMPPGVVGVSEDVMYARGFRYVDLVRAVDVVVTKPGYGIISDCVANGTSMLYTSRGRFAEYDILVREMPRVLRCRYLDMSSLLAGRWKRALDALAGSPPPPERARTDGAAVVTSSILDRTQPWSLA